jgi:cell division septum initiation protein DivIVA
MIETATAINTLPSAARQAGFVSPSDHQLITLTYGQLQGLIEAAIRPLQDEIAQLQEELASLEKVQDTLSDNQLIQLRLINELKEKVNQESQSSATTTKKTIDHIDDLYRLMIEEKTQQVSIAKAARLLGISKERMRQLKPLILKDDRFEMGWASVAGRKGAVIRIRKFL